MSKEVIIVGGGISGLVAAKNLSEAGLDVKLLEKNEKIGGRVRSFRQNGFIFDRGFQVLFTEYPDAKKELNYKELNLQYFNPGTYIGNKNGIYLLSDPIRDPRGVFKSLLNTKITIRDKLKTLILNKKLKKKSLEDISSEKEVAIDQYLIEKGFSQKFIKNFARPFYGGITLDRGLKNSSFIFKYTFKMMAEGKIAVPASGMQAIPNQIAEKARLEGTDIIKRCKVQNITHNKDYITFETKNKNYTADAGIIATDPQNAYNLTKVDSIPRTKRGCITQYYSLSEPLDTNRRIIVNSEDDLPNHICPVSEISPEYSPEKNHLISSTFLSNFNKSDSELANFTLKKLKNWYPKKSFDDLELLETYRIPFAQYKQLPNFRKNLPDITDPKDNIYLAGDYTEWSSINGAISSGKKAAKVLLSDL